MKDAEIRIKAKGDIGGEKMAKNNRRERERDEWRGVRGKDEGKKER